MDSGLLRQRRNLVSISSILIVYDFAEIKIKQVGWMGTSIEVGNPAALSIIIWIVWLYFFLRYYQYWSSEKDANVWSDLNNLVGYRAIAYCEKKYSLDQNFNWDGSYALKRKGIFRWCVTVNDYQVNLKGGEVPSYHMPVLLMMGWSLVVLCKYCINKKHMSEHVLPFLLAICAPLVKIYSMF